MIPVTFIATGIELAILVDVNRDVENIGIVVESLLHSVSCLYVRLLFRWKVDVGIYPRIP